MSTSDTPAPAKARGSGRAAAPVDNRIKIVDATMKRYQFQSDALIEVLHKAQELYGNLDTRLLLHIAHSLKLPPSRVYGVATFYHFPLALPAQGEHSCVVCLGTACYVKGAAAILAAIEAEFNIQAGETTSDGKLSLSSARCLGACGFAPAIVCDGAVSGRQTNESAVTQLQRLVEHGSG